MTDLSANILGVAAAVCSMTSFAPQLVKIWRERDASSVSLRMYLITVAGFVLWTVYGVVIGRWPVVGSNGVCLAMSGAVLVLKYRFDKRQPAN
jgi:MtN3 and saliva related transmembrane protein